MVVVRSDVDMESSDSLWLPPQNTSSIRQGRLQSLSLGIRRELVILCAPAPGILFPCHGGREGLVDTAVNAAETTTSTSQGIRGHHGLL